MKGLDETGHDAWHGLGNLTAEDVALEDGRLVRVAARAREGEAGRVRRSGRTLGEVNDALDRVARHHLAT